MIDMIPVSREWCYAGEIEDIYVDISDSIRADPRATYFKNYDETQ